MTFQHGDITVLGEPPHRLRLALMAIADRLHQNEDSKGACILSSLAVRDFFGLVGYAASVRSVGVAIQGMDGIRYAIGQPNAEPKAGLWAGHLVAEVATNRERWLIDTTLFPHIRPEWQMAGMLALPISAESLGAVSGFALIAGVKTTRGLSIAYLDNPHNNGWQHLPHALAKDEHRAMARRCWTSFEAAA